MLSEKDLEFMRDSQSEIYELRERPITVFYTEVERDEITGEPIGEKEFDLKVSAIVTENSGEVRSVSEGTLFEAGDAKFDIKIEQLKGIAVLVERIEYDGKKYEILGDNKKGIGIRNRIEFIGRVIS